MRRAIILELLVVMFSAFDAGRVSAQTPLAPPYPQGSTYYKGMVISQQGFGVPGCTNSQVPAADGNGCVTVGGNGPFVSLVDTSLQTMNGPLATKIIQGLNLYPAVQVPMSTTADTTIGSNDITVASATGLQIGMSIYSSFVGACSTALEAFTGPYIVNVIGNIVTMSCPANSSVVGSSVTFGDSVTDTTSSVMYNTIQAKLLIGGILSKNPMPLIGTDYKAYSALFGSTQYGQALTAFSLASTNTSGTSGSRSINCMQYIDSWAGGTPIPSWCMYLQSNLSLATANGDQHIQTESSIDSEWPAVASDPFLDNALNYTIAHRYDCGTGQSVAPYPNNCSVVIDVVPNPVAFETGIVFHNNSLVTAAGRIAPALFMVPNQSVEWNSALGTRGGRIYLDGSNTLQIYAANNVGLESSVLMEPGCFYAGTCGSGNSDSVGVVFQSVSAGVTSQGYLYRVGGANPYLYSTDPFVAYRVTATTNMRAAHYEVSGVPTIACGTGAGTSPTVCTITGNDEAGQIAVTTGTTPASSAVIVTVTLANACPTTIYPVVRSSNAAASQLTGVSHDYPNNFTANTWSLTSNTTGLTAATAYTWVYNAKCN